MSEEAVTVEDLAERAEAHLHDTSLTPEEYEALKQSVAELSPIFSAHRAYFVLGSYGQPEIRRLQSVKDRLNRRPDAYAFLMVDIRSEWVNTYLKFRLLADYTDYIVGIAEHAQGGFLVEQGYFTALEEYFAKHTSVSERTTHSIPTMSIPALISRTHTAGCRQRFSKCSKTTGDSIGGPPRRTSSRVSKPSREPKRTGSSKACPGNPIRTDPPLLRGG